MPWVYIGNKNWWVGVNYVFIDLKSLVVIIVNDERSDKGMDWSNLFEVTMQGYYYFSTKDYNNYY